MKKRTKIALSLLTLTFLKSNPGLAASVETAFEQDTNLPLVTLNLAFRGGSAREPEGQDGIANFMGEMLLRGTLHRSKAEIDKEMDRIGAELEVEPRLESIVFRSSFLSSEMKNFFQLIQEILTEPAFPEAEIKKLKSEMQAAILSERGNDAALASKKFSHFLFGTHPYGRSTLGTLKSIQNLTRDQIVSFYKKTIQKKALIAAGCGDLKPEALTTWLEAWTSKLQLGSDPSPIESPKSAETHGIQVLLVDKPERTQTQIILGQIGVSISDPRFYALSLGNHVFGGGMFSSRLMSEVRVKRGWSYGARSSFRFGTMSRQWSVHLFPATQYTPDAVELVLSLIDVLKKKGISLEEFAFAKESLVNGAGFSYNTPAKRVENLLLEKSLRLKEGFIRNMSQEIERLKLEDVNAALTDFLAPESLKVVIVATAKELKPRLMEKLKIKADRIQIAPALNDD
jgi:zinc protease